MTPSYSTLKGGYNGAFAYCTSLQYISLPESLEIIEDSAFAFCSSLETVGFELHVDEVLIALSICAATNPMAQKAIDQLPLLKGLEAHSTVMLASVDKQTFKKLGVNMTNEPKTQTKKLYYK